MLHTPVLARYMQAPGHANQQLEQSVALVKALLLCVGLLREQEVQKEVPKVNTSHPDGMTADNG
jgi:hypothetical protein